VQKQHTAGLGAGVLLRMGQHDKPFRISFISSQCFSRSSQLLDQARRNAGWPPKTQPTEAIS
jgi:hypothetical protein